MSHVIYVGGPAGLFRGYPAGREETALSRVKHKVQSTKEPTTPTRQRGRPQVQPASEQALDALWSVIDETRSLFHRLKLAAERMHHTGELTAGKRDVLMDLARFGPRSVPQMARARPVSRQHIQTLANLLAAEGHVEFIDNPAHKRSHLVGLTRRGHRLVHAMRRRETKLLGRLTLDVGEKDLLAAAAVLRSVRAAFASEQWQRLVETVR